MSTPIPAVPTAAPSTTDGSVDTTAPTPRTSHARMHSTWAATARAALIASAVVSLVLLAFAWPSYASKVRGLPITIAGHPTVTAPVEKALAGRDTFAVTRAADRASAVSGIRQRDSYGSIVVSSRRIEVLTSSAASPVAAQALNAVAQNVQTQSQARALAAARTGARVETPRVVTTDVVPLSGDDPRGTLIAVAALPLAMGGMIGGVLISLLVVGHWRRVAAVLTYGVVGGLLLTLVLGPWFGALHGAFALEWLTIGLALAATGSLIVGLNSLIGPPGIAVGAVITMFVGNPLASANSPQEFLPWHWGDIGQGFVPGAASTLLRVLSYFPDASTARYWWTLVLWAAFGTVLSVLGHFRDQRVLPGVGGLEPDTDDHAGHTNRRTRPEHDTPAAPTGTAPITTPDLASGAAPSTWALPVATGPDAADRSTGRGALHGTVTGAGAHPLAGAHVTITDDTGHEVGHTVTATDGGYRLTLPRPGAYLLIATAPGSLPTAQRVVMDSPAHRHDIHLTTSDGQATPA